MNKVFKTLCKKIKEYEYIVIVRHVSSDLDALGSQFGLKEWINLNYKNKKVYCIGENNSKLMKNFFPKSDAIDFDVDNTKFLGICVDVSELPRVDGAETFKKADYTICLDHHETSKPDKFDAILIEGKKIACSEIIAGFLLKSFKKMNTNVCKYLFAGISGDSGNFYYEATSSDTFKTAAKLLKKGNFNQYKDFHFLVGFETLKEAQLKNKLFEKLVYDEKSGVAYYITSLKEAEEWNVTPRETNEQIARFNKIEEFKIVLSAAEFEEGMYKCSLRSKEKDIASVAANYGGGGHKCACGVKGINKEQLDNLIEDLKKI